MLSAKEAATAVGMTKAGIIRSIHTGKLSATRSDNGQFVIDPAELFRVYDPLTDGVNGHGNIDREVSTAGNFAPKIDSNGAVLHEDTWLTQLTLLERIIRSHEETIADLRRRLDASTAQVDQMAAVIAQLQPPKAKTGWWQRLLGGQ